jgi:hypothetical protein
VHGSQSSSLRYSNSSSRRTEQDLQHLSVTMDSETEFDDDDDDSSDDLTSVTASCSFRRLS